MVMSRYGATRQFSLGGGETVPVGLADGLLDGEEEGDLDGDGDGLGLCDGLAEGDEDGVGPEGPVSARSSA
jgi:hypothetical protein